MDRPGIRQVASHADVLRGSSLVPAPRTSAHSRIPDLGSVLWILRNVWLDSCRKDQKGLMKGVDLKVLEQTTQLTHKRSYFMSK